MPYIGKSPQLRGAYEKVDDISGSFDGVTTTFNINVNSVAKTLASANQLLLVYVDFEYALHRRMVEPDVGYTISGSTITFAVAPDTNDVCWMLILGDLS